MKNGLKIIFYIVIGVVFFLSIGYSAFTASINIDNILAEVRIKEDIRITGVSVSDSSDGVVSLYEEYNVSSINSSVSFNDANSYITYKIEITNIESAEMGLFEITGLSDELTYNIESGYNEKDKLCDDDDSSMCNLGSVTNIYVTIRYNTSEITNTDFVINLDFDFRGFHKITYSNITNNGYPTEIINGDDLSITFVDDIPSNIAVLGTTDYTYESPILTILNVTSDLTISNDEVVVPPGDGAAITFIKNAYGGEENYASNGLYVSDAGELYYAGSTSVNNYVQLGTDAVLWQIISMDEENGTIKMVRGYDESLKGSYDLDSNDWETSDILVNLNTWYTDNLTDYNDIIVQNPTWDLVQIDGTDASSATIAGSYSGSPIGLINIIEYTQSIDGATWMQAKYQWTMTTPIGNSSRAIRINGTKYLSSSVDSENTVYRPVIYLNSSAIFDSGNGTDATPFVIL